MSAATLAMIVQIVELLMGAAGQVPSLISLGEQAKALLSSNTDPTPEQEASIRAALDAANAALQSA